MISVSITEKPARTKLMAAAVIVALGLLLIGIGAFPHSGAEAQQNSESGFLVMSNNSLYP
jgi:hypothetical protein